MGRAPCCDKANVKRGPWSTEEDAKLKEFIEKYGTGGNWISLPQKAGLKRCGKSCRLRWLNYLRPNIKHGDFSEEDDRTICTLFATIGSRWSIIAAQLPGRTDNDIKNYWNTKLKKKLMGIHTNHNLTSQRRSSSPFTSYLQIPSQAESLSTLSHLFQNCSPFHTEAKSLIPLESIPLSQNFQYNNNCVSLAENHYFNSCFPFQEGLMMNHGQNYPLKDNNFQIFGGNNNEASCSSSDGSCTRMSYGKKEIKQENISLSHGYISHGGFHEANESKMVNLDYVTTTNGDGHVHYWKQGGGIFGNSQYQSLQNDLEEVKHLISCSSNDDSFNLSNENKTHERTMYFY